MAAVTICSDFGAPPNKSLTLFLLFPHLFPMKWWDQMPWSSFSECWALSQLLHSPLSLSSTGFLAPLHFLPKGWCHLFKMAQYPWSCFSWGILIPPHSPPSLRGFSGPPSSVITSESHEKQRFRNQKKTWALYLSVFVFIYLRWILNRFLSLSVFIYTGILFL